MEHLKDSIEEAAHVEPWRNYFQWRNVTQVLIPFVFTELFKSVVQGVGVGFGIYFAATFIIGSSLHWKSALLGLHPFLKRHV
jgi:hypothetical protein